MSFSALQGATLITAHASFTKIMVSFTLRVYQYLETNEKRRLQVESSRYVQDFQKAQMNEAEYAALLAAPLFYLAALGVPARSAATLAVVGQVAYVWMRTLVGYPCLPTISMALVRYGGMVFILSELWKISFPTHKKA